MAKSKEKFRVYKNVFDRFTLRTLFTLSSHDHFEDLLSPVMIGKEANIFLASTKQGTPVIVKIYRLHTCNFNKMYGYIHGDPRFMKIKNQRRLVIMSWVEREFRNLEHAKKHIIVPEPIALKNHVIVMESIGENKPSPQLKDVQLEKPQQMIDTILSDTYTLIKSGMVHGDLSEFNILVRKNKPVYIDFSQSTVTTDPHAKEYVERDIVNLHRFASKIGARFDKDRWNKKMLDAFPKH